jgi:hypothetical protein
MGSETIGSSWSIAGVHLGIILTTRSASASNREIDFRLVQPLNTSAANFLILIPSRNTTFSSEVQLRKAWSDIQLTIRMRLSWMIGLISASSRSSPSNRHGSQRIRALGCPRKVQGQTCRHLYNYRHLWRKSNVHYRRK